MGLQMKYFVLNPLKDNAFGRASRAALETYAREIFDTDSKLSRSLIIWIGKINRKIIDDTPLR